MQKPNINISSKINIVREATKSGELGSYQAVRQLDDDHKTQGAWGPAMRV